MRAHEIINEDDYYPPEPEDNSRSVEELEQFLDLYVQEELGEPHRANAKLDRRVIVAIPRNKNRKAGQRWDYDGQREEWLDTAQDLSESLELNGFGRYELVAVTASYIELDLKHATVNETTCAGGIATVVGGMAPAITRNASIYGSDNKTTKKKKKKNKYANSAPKD